MALANLEEFGEYLIKVHASLKEFKKTHQLVKGWVKLLVIRIGCGVGSPSDPVPLCQELYFLPSGPLR